VGRFRWASMLLASGVLVLALSASAQAATVTLGNPLTGPIEEIGNCPSPEGCATALLGVSDPGAQAASPSDGTMSAGALPARANSSVTSSTSCATKGKASSR
jgi:hypothetical protein